MNRLPRVLPLLTGVLLAIASPVRADSLTTLFAENNGHDGTMFDVVVGANPLLVTSFDLNVYGTGGVELYIKSGTWVGSEDDPTAWTLIDTMSDVVTNGADNPTPVNFADFHLPADQTTAFYLTGNSTGLDFGYTDGTAVGNVAASNSALSILEGAGKMYPFGDTFDPRIWNGTIYYNVVPEPASVLLLGLGGVALVLGVTRRAKARRAV